MRHSGALACFLTALALFTEPPTAKGQASNSIKSRRLAAYHGENITGYAGYNFLVGTYKKANEAAVRAFLTSLGMPFGFPKNLRSEYTTDPYPKAIDRGRSWNPRLTVADGEAVFTVPYDPSSVQTVAPKDFLDLDPFKVQSVVLQIAKSALINDFLLGADGIGASPQMSAGYNINPRVVFADPAHPTAEQVLDHLHTVLAPFFKQFGGRLDLTQQGPTSYNFKLNVVDMHNGVLQEVKDAERLHGYVIVAPQFDANVVDLEIYFTGEYAPMPFNQPPPEARYVDLEDSKVGNFADQLSTYLQTHYHAKLTATRNSDTQ